MKKRLLKFLHNVVSHPLLELPFGWGFPLHDWSAQLAFGHLYYIWWLTQEEMELCQGFIDDLPEGLAAEMRSATGRVGRGRLWDSITPDPVSVDPWPRSPMAEHCHHCAGIVIEAEYMRYIRTLPGVVTDTQLRRVGE